MIRTNAVFPANNAVFPAIKYNPTTNYSITHEDEVREVINKLNSSSDWPPHERYLGELETRL